MCTLISCAGGSLYDKGTWHYLKVETVHQWLANAPSMVGVLKMKQNHENMNIARVEGVNFGNQLHIWALYN